MRFIKLTYSQRRDDNIDGINHRRAYIRRKVAQLKRSSPACLFEFYKRTRVHTNRHVPRTFIHMIYVLEKFNHFPTGIWSGATRCSAERAACRIAPEVRHCRGRLFLRLIIIIIPVDKPTYRVGQEY